MAVVFTDTFTGASGAAWDSTKWTVTNASGTSTINASGQGVQNIIAGTGTSTYALSKNTALTTQEVYFEVPGKTTPGNGVWSVQIMTSGTLATSTTTAGAWYTNGFRLWGLLNTTTSTLEKIVAGTKTSLSTAIPGIPASGTQAYRIRYDATTATLSVRSWLTSGAEPSTWNYQAVQTSPSTTAGTLFLALRQGATSAAQSIIYDNISIDDLTVVVNAAPGSQNPMTATAATADPVVSTSKTANYNAQVSTATSLAVDPVVATQRSVNYAGQVGTVTAASPDAAFAAQKTVNYNAQVSTVGAFFPDPKQSLDANWLANNAMTATAAMFQPVLYVQRIVNYTAQVSTATAMAPAAVVSGSANVLATPATAQTTSPNAAVSAIKNVSVTATVLTASALAPVAVASGSASFLATRMVATAGMTQATDRGDANTTSTPATAAATGVDAAVRVTSDVLTTWDEYPTGVFPPDWTLRLGTPMGVEAIAGTLSGYALRGPNINATSLQTWDDIQPSSTGEILVRVAGQDTGPAVWLGGVWYAAVRYGTDLSLVDYNGNRTTYPASLGSGYNWIRLSLTSTGITAKAWQNGEAEPSGPTFTVTLAHGTASFGAYAYLNGGPFIDFFSANSGGAARNYNLGKEIHAAALTATAESVTPVVGVGNTREVAPSLATAVAVQPSVTTTLAVTFAAEAMTASADAVAAEVVTPDVTNFASATTATAAMSEPSVEIKYNREVSVVAMTAAGEMVHPAFTNMTDRIISASAMDAAARIVYYSETEDPFIAIIDGEFSGPQQPNDLWLRFGQPTVGALRNYAADTDERIGHWEGSPEFLVTDEYSRKATHFSGDDTYVYLDNEGTSTYPIGPLTWEVVFRCTEDGPLFSGERPASLGTAFVGGMEIINGRVGAINIGVTNGPTVTDGKWHHAMLTVGTRGVEVFVDGVSRLVRRAGSANTGGAVPIERIGVSSNYYGSLAPRFFKGDILTVAQYQRQLPREAGNRHYYAYVQATVVGAGPSTATATAGNSKGRGNQLRALGLYFDGGSDYRGGGVNANASGIRISVQSGNNITYDETPFTLGPYLVFPRSINGYREDYDYSPRYIDLQQDVENIHDFDMVFFIDLPDRNRVLDDRFNTGDYVNMSLAYEKMMESIRWANDQGLALWVPQPEVAQALGIIDALDVHSLEVEQSGDVKAWREDDPVWKGQNGATVNNYRDTHYNNKYRITAQLEGLTDLGGYVMDDVVYWYNDNNPFSARPDYVKWNVKEVANGLHIGDTLYMPVDVFKQAGTSNGAQETDRTVVISVPEGHYTGTAVAKELGTINMQGEEVPNPYGNNALSIVLRPGDVLNGRPVGGKIVADFMSGYRVSNNPTQLPVVWRQVGPFDNGSNTGGLRFDDYDYDSRRQNSYFTFLTFSFIVTTTKGGLQKSNTTDVQVPQFTYFERFPIQVMTQYPMLAREFNWLGAKEEQPEGSVRVFTNAMTAVVETGDTTTAVQRHAVLGTTPAAALANIIKPASVVEPDVEIKTLPMTAQAQAVAPPKVVSAGVATATAAMVENVETVGQGEDFVVYLHTMDATLYLKEDA